MKYLLIILCVFYSLSLFSQDSPEIELMNQVLAKRRTELNKSDSIFINKALIKIEFCNCMNVDTIIKSHKYSNVIVYELVKESLQMDTICSRVILNNILYFSQHPTSDQYHDSNNFPVTLAIFSNANNAILLAEYLIGSCYLEAIDILKKNPPEFSMTLRNILMSKIDLGDIEKMRIKITNLESILRE